ncbi:Hypothetical protein, putative [Bodo saltans]|uniref:WD40 repeat-containing protein n=1 Tax=Bodo saltans TaxID=75058 RepID=A0A0S4JB00_BODSA|nr:Hypothetical protein, putative [Bodo saltans]|eukprot:CUG86149.1 Hypothetical protein, putative [Bodo saltans]
MDSDSLMDSVARRVDKTASSSRTEIALSALSRLLLDSFVTESSGGIAGIERSLWAHRWQLGAECGSVAYNLLPNEKGTSRSEGDRIAAYYETVAAKKLSLVQTKNRPASPSRRLHGRRSHNCSFVTRIPEESGPLGNVLSRAEMSQAIRDVDLFDKLSSTVDETVLTLTMSHSISARTNAVVSLGAFSYVVSRTMLRAALLQMPREEIASLGAVAQDEVVKDTSINTLLVRLLPAARAAAVQWFTTVDVDGLGLVPWSTITSALVEYCGSEHLKRCLDDALGDVLGPSEAVVCGSVDETFSLTSAVTPPLPTRRIGTYDRYHCEAFPIAKAIKNYLNAVIVVHNSPYLILEGRADTHALVSREDVTSVRHTFARHRVEGTKICGSTVVFATVIDAGSTPALCVAEVDMNVHLYDFSSKQRRVLPLLVRVRVDSAIVACCYILRSTSLVVGDRTGTLRAVDARALVLQAHEAFARKPGDEEVEDSEREMSFTDAAFFCETVHKDAVTGITQAAPSLLLSSSLDGCVSVVHATTWTRIRTFSAHGGIGIRSIAGDESLTTFVTHAYDGTTLLWFSAHGVNNSRLLEPLVPHQHRVDWMFVDASVQQLLTVDVSGLVKVWDMHQHAIISTFFAVTEMPSYLEGQEHALGTSTMLEGDGGLIKELPYDVAPAQCVSYDYFKHRLFVRGFQNDVVSTLVEGRKSLTAHPMAVRALFASETCAVSLCAKALRAWSFPLLELRCEVPSSLRLAQGDTPPPLPHQVAEHIGLGEHRVTRSDVLHEAIDPEGITTGGHTSASHKQNSEIGLGDVTLQEACATCMDADRSHVFVVMGNGEVRCYQSGTGKCVKVFAAQKLLNTQQKWAHHTTACGRSLDAVSCCYIDQDHMLAVCYADGAIRYFSNIGALRSAFGVQVLSEDMHSTRGNTDVVSPPGMGPRLSISISAGSPMSMSSSPRKQDRQFISDNLDESITSLSTSTTGSLRTAAVGIAVSTCNSTLRLAANAYTDGRVEVVELAMTQPIVKIVHTLTVQHEVLSMQFVGDFAGLLIADADANLRGYAVRGSPLLSVANELISNAQTMDRKRRVSRAFNVSPTAGARTPTAPSLPVSLAKRRSIIAAVATMTSPKAPATPSAPTSGKGSQLCCISSVNLVAKATTLAFVGGTSSMVVAGLHDGRLQILYAHGLIHCLTLASPGSSPMPYNPLTPTTPNLDGKYHIQSIREAASKLLTQLFPADESEEVSPFITSTNPGSLKMDSWAPASHVSLANAMVATMLLQLLTSAAAMFPQGITLDRAAQTIGTWLLRNPSYSSPMATSTLRVHFELVPLMTSTWVHEDVIHLRPDVSCFANFAGKLESSVTQLTKDMKRLTIDESVMNMDTHTNSYDISAPITAIVAIGANLLLVGNQSGEIAMTSMTAGGSIATLNSGASLAGSLSDRLLEWQRGYAYAHHKAFVAHTAAGGVALPPGQTAPLGGPTGAPTPVRRLPSDLYQVGDTFEVWAEAPIPIASVGDFLQQQCLSLLQALSRDSRADDAGCGRQEANMMFVWDKLERHVGASAIAEDSADNTPQESFLEAFNTGVVRLSSPPTKSPGRANMLKTTPLTPAIVMGSAIFSEIAAVKPISRNFTRSPRAASFLTQDIPVSDVPAPPLIGFLSSVSQSQRPTTPNVEGHDSPQQESLNGSVSLFETRPKKSRTAPRVALAPSAPLPRPMSAGDAAKCEMAQHFISSAALTPRQAAGRSRVHRLPLDMRLRYALHDDYRSCGPLPPPAANKTREMAMTTSMNSASLSERMKQFSTVNQASAKTATIDIGFGLMLQSK